MITIALQGIRIDFIARWTHNVLGMSNLLCLLVEIGVNPKVVYAQLLGITSFFHHYANQIHVVKNVKAEKKNQKPIIQRS